MLGTCHYLMLPFLRQLLFDYVHLMDVVWKSLSDTLNMSWAGPWEVGGGGSTCFTTSRAQGFFQVVGPGELLLHNGSLSHWSLTV